MRVRISSLRSRTVRVRASSSATCAAYASSRMLNELVACEPRQRKRVPRVVDRAADQGFGALAHQPGIGTENQHDRSRPIGPRHESIDLRGFECRHENS